MLFLLIILSFWGPAVFTSAQNLPLFSTPRKTVSLSRNGGYIFQEEGVRNYSAMLFMEDMGVLILGARETILALDLANITHKKDMIKWEVTPDKWNTCLHKGRNLQTECWNYIRAIHRWKDGRMYVCGTNAFSPACKHLSYTNGELTLENKTLNGYGKCPFDPFQRYVYEFFDDELYSATSMDFLGRDMAIMRHPDRIRTVDSDSWFNDPTFIGIKNVTKGMENPDGDDDEIYLFFSETAVEYDSYVKLDVSRVARVCKRDVGGVMPMHKRWTSFLKAQLDCPVLQTKLPLIIKDVFLFCPGNWTTCVFYGVFTSQSDMLQFSALCTYRINDIRKVYSEGKFKTLHIDGNFSKWMTYLGELPDPRPGACINDDARQKGIFRSNYLPDETLLFIRDNPLMDQAVKPSYKQPLLLKKGAAFTSIVVANTTALDGTSHQVMFIGTASGSVLKAVNYDRKMVIIEEVQLFNHNEPVKILRLSTAMGLLYAGSEEAVAQMPFCACSKYTSCTDCVLARDPYCGWDLVSKSCIAISNIHSDEHREVVQGLKDATRCPAVENTKIIKIFYPGQMVSLPCQLESNLSRVQWRVNDQPIENDKKYNFQHGSLLILNVSDTDKGNYKCICVESFNGQDYVIQTTTYELRLEEFVDPQTQQALVEMQDTLLPLVIILALILLAIITWNFYKGHYSVPRWFKKNITQWSLHIRDQIKEPSVAFNSNDNRISGLPSAEDQDNDDIVYFSFF
ncbi:semaphorin-4E-like isoform X2 [Silurus meridionalis]|uniref:semaphorin-4E-like isoform X2 n=1 Tax=Silurus meridionalis TaxID=175797 RepID=UPI001EEAFD9F|nr:semaphorin-4E-like isoform X2 [Silurus meridionalis]